MKTTRLNGTVHELRFDMPLVSEEQIIMGHIDLKRVQNLQHLPDPTHESCIYFTSPPLQLPAFLSALKSFKTHEHLFIKP